MKKLGQFIQAGPPQDVPKGRDPPKFVTARRKAIAAARSHRAEFPQGKGPVRRAHSFACKKDGAAVKHQDRQTDKRHHGQQERQQHQGKPKVE